jgi:hypothetical protein
MSDATNSNQEITLAQALETNHPIVRDIKARMEQYGNITPAQVALVLRLAADAAKPKVPVVPGRFTVMGTVVSLKLKQTRFGESMKMLLETSDGQRIWGTCPAALLRLGKDPTGKLVRLTATIEASPNDPCFGFFNRPTDASYVSGGQHLL